MYKTFKENVFNKKLLVVLDEPLQECKYLKWAGIPSDMLSTDDMSGVHYEVKREDGRCLNIIWVSDFGWKIAGISTLAHELIHFVENICERMSIKDGETRAYLHSYYFAEIMYWYNSNKKD